MQAGNRPTGLSVSSRIGTVKLGDGANCCCGPPHCPGTPSGTNEIPILAGVALGTAATAVPVAPSEVTARPQTNAARPLTQNTSHFTLPQCGTMTRRVHQSTSRSTAEPGQSRT